jgi:hypothetical protein
MPSLDLQKICRDMNALGEKLDVEITSSGSDLIFKCMGDFAEQGLLGICIQTGR